MRLFQYCNSAPGPTSSASRRTCSLSVNISSICRCHTDSSSSICFTISPLLPITSTHLHCTLISLCLHKAIVCYCNSVCLSVCLSVRPSVHLSVLQSATLMISFKMAKYNYIINVFSSPAFPSITQNGRHAYFYCKHVNLSTCTNEFTCSLINLSEMKTVHVTGLLVYLLAVL